ncbi:MAG: hypothetical protein ABSH42_07355 [Bryobacteraceae bacterium]|jgi:hypothetical protein
MPAATDPAHDEFGGPANRQFSLIELCFDRFLSLWQDNKALPPARLNIVFLAGLAIICGATVFIGAVPTRIDGHDIFFLLDNGWRVINGLRPHVDYYSPWGPLMFLVSGLGLRLSGYMVDGIGYGSAVVAMIVGIWSFSLAKERLAPSPRLLLSFFLAALVAAPYPLSISPFASSHAMVYNRYGYALLGLILTETLNPRRGRTRELPGGISTGAALSLALFLKASYFFAAVVLIGVISLILWRVAWRRILGILLGFSLMSACMLAYLRFDVAAVLADLRMAAGARAESLGPDVPLWNILGHAPVLLEVVLFSFAAALVFGSRAQQWRGLKLPIVGIILFFADISIISSNQQSGSFPVCAVFAILMLSEVTEDQQALLPAEGHSLRPNYGAVLCLGALLFVPQFTGDLAGLAYGTWKKARPSTPAAVLRFTSPNLRTLLLYDNATNPHSNGREYVTYVNDGVALLERETRRNETVLTMDMSNPFPYALERRPPHGGIAAMAYHYGLNDAHRPSDDRYFGDADIVMLPKRPALDPAYYIDFLKAYKPGLQQRYNLAAESDWWLLYRRK